VCATVGAQNSITPRDLRVFVQEAAEPVAAGGVEVSVRWGSGSGRSGAAWPRARCGRCALKCRSYSARTATALQPSDSPTADVVAEAISCAPRQLGVGGCAGRMAQELGDHPDAAAGRMRWVRQLAHAAGGGR
jgi:hypothetical protein